VVRAIGWEIRSKGAMNTRLRKRASELGFDYLAEKIGGNRTLLVWQSDCRQKIKKKQFVSRMIGPPLSKKWAELSVEGLIEI